MSVKYTKFKDIPQRIGPGNYSVDMSFDYLVSQLTRWESHTLEDDGQPPLQMNPDFQRGHVWSQEQQVAYIEFLLTGGQSGRDLYFNCPSWQLPVPEGAYNDFVCVDGLQRFSAIKAFIHDELMVFGSFFSEFEDSIRLSNTVRIHINDLKTKKEVLLWYLQMNAGGTPHSPAEINRIKEMYEKEEG